MQWRQPCSIHLCDEHGCIQPVDAGGETTRRREPRGVSGTLKVSPTGSIPHRENPAGKSPMTRSKPLGPSFASGSKHQREYGHGHASPDRSVETSNDQNQISQTQVHGTRGRRRRWHDRFRWGLLVADAWADDALKKRLLSDPAAVLKERGITTPPNVQIKTIEDTANVMHLVLPMKPAAAELSEEELSTVAGGWCGGCHGCHGCGCRGCRGCGVGCRGCGVGCGCVPPVVVVP